MNWGLVIIHKINHDIRLVAYTNKFIINGV